MRIPFKKFIIGLLLKNKDIEYISQTIKKFHYYITDDSIEEIYESLKNDMPAKLKENVNNRTSFKLTVDDALWIEHLGVAELYDYISRRDTIAKEDRLPYYKWFDECFWVHDHEDVMSLINIFIFNEEPLINISRIIHYKYKKKIGVHALRMYMNIFWDCRGVTAKEALYHCMPFRKNALILKNIKGGEHRMIAELQKYEDDGSDTSLVLHDSSYIKWKIGYTEDVNIPTIKDFMNKVKVDSYYKYYEAMNMTQSVEYEEQIGNSAEGPFDSSTTRYKNVERQKAKQVKHWMDVFIKADKSIPDEVESDDQFFEDMKTLKLEFEDEKLLSIKDAKDIMEDIKGDINREV